MASANVASAMIAWQRPMGSRPARLSADCAVLERKYAGRLQQDNVLPCPAMAHTRKKRGARCGGYR